VWNAGQQSQCLKCSRHIRGCHSERGKHTATNRAVSRRARIGVTRVTRDRGPAQACPHNSCVAAPRAGWAVA